MRSNKIYIKQSKESWKRITDYDQTYHSIA